MPEVMLQLGDYQFGVDTAAYQSLRHAANFRWEAQSRVGARDALQFTGQGEETITLAGVVHPHFKGGARQIEAMRTEATKGDPLNLIDGLGNVLGRWSIMSVEVDHSSFVPRGLPRKQDFTLTIRKYDDGA